MQSLHHLDMFYTVLTGEKDGIPSVKMNPLVKINGTPHFDPVEDDLNTLHAFTEFIESLEMWYDVASI